MAPSRRKYFERGEPDHPLTPKKLELLVWLSRVELATADMLVALTNATYSGISKHLLDLYHGGYVDRLPISRLWLVPRGEAHKPSHALGMPVMIYALAELGIQTLMEGRYITREQAASLQRYAKKKGTFLAHELETREVHVWLRLLERQYGHAGLSRWVTGSKTALGPVEPDAWFVYDLRGEHALVGFVEIDRATEGADRWREKFHQYRALLASGKIQETIGRDTGRVLIVVPDEARRVWISGLLTDLVAAYPTNPADRFWLTVRSTLEQADLSAPLWQVPGRPLLQPFVPQAAL